MSQKENADHIGCDVKVIRVLQQDTSAMPVRRWLVEELTEIPKRRTGASAKTLRPVLGPIRLTPTNGDIGRACCVVKTSIEAVTVLEPSDAENRRPGGSNSSRLWSRSGSITPKVRSRSLQR